MCSSTTAVGDHGIGSDFGLGPAVPNPSRGAMSLSYRIPERSRVAVEVFTVSGRKVRTLLDEMRDPGPGQVRLDARGLGSGIYLVRLQAGGRSQVRAVTLRH